MEEPVTASMWEMAQDSDGCLRVKLERDLGEASVNFRNWHLADMSRRTDDVCSRL